jgi:CYTH domain-containing protein
MALEIERRFLVQGLDWRRHIRWQAQLQQGYLVVTADGFTLRVRRVTGDEAVAGAWLTLKARL